MEGGSMDTTAVAMEPRARRRGAQQASEPAGEPTQEGQQPDAGGAVGRSASKSAGRKAKKKAVPKIKQQVSFSAVTSWELGLAVLHYGKPANVLLEEWARPHLAAVPKPTRPEWLNRLTNATDSPEEVSAN